MGFDIILCRYALPHHQDATFETRDLPELSMGLSDVEGTFDEYEITEEGALRRRMRVTVWRVDRSSPGDGYFETIDDWWQDVQSAHGRIRMYSDDGMPGAADYQRIEFCVSFRKGRVAWVSEQKAKRPRAGRNR